MTMRVNPELCTVYCYLGGCTLPKTNIAPENRPSQKESSIPTIHFRVQAVRFRDGILYGLLGGFPTISR